VSAEQAVREAARFRGGGTSFFATTRATAAPHLVEDYLSCDSPSRGFARTVISGLELREKNDIDLKRAFAPLRVQTQSGA
jgi:hypothetical protein